MGFSFNPTDEFLEYDPVQDQWTPRAPLPSARGAAAAAAIEGKIYTVGGDSVFGLSGELTVYDPDTNVWSPLPSMP
ncbi:MAG: galactose oxidase, partial [Anaerolineae bacterium]|nr:galactose oxidase [Anaerolineae bacterium]